MPKHVADALPDGCPWSGWTPPNVDWCEEEICSWVVNPADTWSNIAYLAMGVLMWHQSRKLGNPRLVIFGPASIIVGVASLAYHASYTYFLQFFDFVGMFLFCFTIITVNAIRLGWIRVQHQWLFLAVGTLMFSTLVPALSETSVPIQSLVALLIAFVLGQELVLYRRGRGVARSKDHLPFVVAIVLIAIAAAFSLADVTRLWCNPKNHWVQGHALWHVFSAASLYALFIFYARLESSESATGSSDA
jgi:hypothetical protein